MKIFEQKKQKSVLRFGKLQNKPENTQMRMPFQSELHPELTV
jgi:hypothetical protein